MACNINKIKSNALSEVKQIIQGNANSISITGDTATFLWGDDFKVKTKDQALRTAQQKLKSVRDWAKKTFGKPFEYGWGYINTGNPGKITMDIKFPKNLEQAYEVKKGVKEFEEVKFEPFEGFSETIDGEVTNEADFNDYMSNNLDDILTQEEIKEYYKKCI